MAYYDLSKNERQNLSDDIKLQIHKALVDGSFRQVLPIWDDEDTYIRKAAYLGTGKLYFEYPESQSAIINLLELFFKNSSFRVRQTAINAAGEIGKKQFEVMQSFFDKGLFDEHHSPRNAVIGSIKKMGEVNPIPVLAWANSYLHHPDKEIRREICHGIELRGRKHPDDILPMLEQLQFDTTNRVSNTLVHVIGQIAYKKGCLQTVLAHLDCWENKALVKKAIAEIIDVHYRYRNFSALTQDSAISYINQYYPHLA